MSDFVLLVLFLVFWIGLAIMNAAIATYKKDQDPTIIFFVSILFGPMVYLYLLALPNRP